MTESATEREGIDAPAAGRGGGFTAALLRNKAFAANGRHEGVGPVPGLGLFVITCLDPRVDPAYVLGLDIGEALVFRNGGGRVTDEVIENVAYVSFLAEGMLPEGPLFEVAVIHHTQCGAGRLADDAFRHGYAERIGVDEQTLRELAVVDPVATVAADVERLHSSDAISSRVTVSGHVYNVSTGLVETVVPAAAVTPGASA